MYFVDRNKIEHILTYMEGLLDTFSTNTWERPIEKYALERIAHMTIEAILDVGNAMIDGFIMRDPGSYEDIIDILYDEKVISEGDSVGLKEIISFRKVVVQQYLEINHQTLLQVFVKHYPSLKQFPLQVRAYLNDELGPVSAFKN